VHAEAAGGGGTARGSLEVTINGLPAGTPGSVTVTGTGFTQTIGESQTLTDLASGNYVVKSGNVLVGNTLYSPQQASQNVSVSAAAVGSVTVSYSTQGALALALQPVVSGLSSPVYLTAPSGDDRLFIVERSGQIRIVQNGALLPTPFLDIASRVLTDGERGLLSMAFDPQYAANGNFFVYFANVAGDIEVDRFTVSSADPNQADPLSGTTIITIPHPSFNNHYGGLLSFGPDGMLYFGTGDGGSEGDPFGNAQNLNLLLGKLLRIDVSASSIAAPYVIPPDNPFAFQAGRRSEIWAYGFRNPWRYAFDAVASLLYIADVGQDRIEEVDVAGTAQAGLNYGWNIMEGSLCYPGDPCDKQGLTLPVLEYAHGTNDSNGCAVIGGYVYRGSAIPELQGRYFYSDLCSGWLKSFVYRNGTATEQAQWSVSSLSSINSFGQDSNNELYVLTGNGDVSRIIRQ